MRVALDTNIIAYVEGVDGASRAQSAVAALIVYDEDELVLSAQVLAELFNVLTRKARRSAEDARLRVLDWSEGYRNVSSTPAVLADAMELVVERRIGWWDAIVMASAVEAECALLLSDDFQPGFSWRGVTVRNPLAA